MFYLNVMPKVLSRSAGEVEQCGLVDPDVVWSCWTRSEPRALKRSKCVTWLVSGRVASRTFKKCTEVHRKHVNSWRHLAGYRESWVGAVCDYAYALNVRSPWQGLGLHVLVIPYYMRGIFQTHCLLMQKMRDLDEKYRLSRCMYIQAVCLVLQLNRDFLKSIIFDSILINLRPSLSKAKAKGRCGVTADRTRDL